MIVTIGDLHLSDDRAWSEETSEKAISIIANHPLNNNDNVGIFVGDITQTAVLSGSMIYFILKLIESLKFKRTYILIGNHDIKKKKNKYTIPLSFLLDKKLRDKYFTDCFLIQEPTALEEEGLNILALPFLPADRDQGVKIYNKLSPEFADKEWDLVVGHFADTSAPAIIKEDTVDLTYLKTRYICLGHIHNPNGNYMGSLIPNATSEAGRERALWSFEKKKDKVKKEVHPVKPILDYYYVSYPDPLPSDTPAEVPVWIVESCKTEEAARNLYGDIYIHSYKKIFDVDFGFFKDYDFKEEKAASSLTLFKSWTDTVKKSYPDDVLKKAEAYIQTL